MLAPSRRGYACTVRLPPRAQGVWIYVFEKIETHWVLRGGGVLCPPDKGAEARVHMHTLAGTPGESDGVARPPDVIVRIAAWRPSPARPLVADRHERLMRYSEQARGEILARMPDLRYAPPLLARTLHGTTPVGATFATRAEIAHETLGDLLSLMCHLERAECEFADLDDAPPQLAARVLARVALVANTMRYIPDEARAIDAHEMLAGATPDAPPDAAAGTVQTNIYTDASMTWTDDCEGDTAITASVWRAIEDGLFDTLDYQFLVLAVTVAHAAPGAYHVCAALVHPTRPCALVESVVRTCGVMEHAAVYHRPKTDAARRRERPLVLLPSGLLNNWYDRVAFAVDPRKPLELLLPHVGDAYGGTVAQLLSREVRLEPMQTTVPGDLAVEILHDCAITPRVNLAPGRLTVSPGDPGLGGGTTMCTRDEPVDGAAIHVRHPEPGVAARAFVFQEAWVE